MRGDGSKIRWCELADERFDLLGELVLDLEVPRHLGDVDDEKQLGEQQRFECGDAEVLEPLADADADGEVV
jgi:hypothetical protein